VQKNLPLVPLLRHLAKTLMEPWAQSRMTELPSATDGAGASETQGGVRVFALVAHKGNKSNFVVRINPHKHVKLHNNIISTE
jgi:hypothetical protein